MKYSYEYKEQCGRLQPHRHKLLRRQSVRGDGAAQGEYLHPGGGGPAEGLAELGVGGVVGRYIFGTGELDDETQGGLIPRLTGGDQPFSMAQATALA